MPGITAPIAAAGAGWLAAAVGWLLGVALQLHQPALWPRWATLVLLALVLLMLAWCLPGRRPTDPGGPQARWTGVWPGALLPLRLMLLGLSLAALGFASTALRAEARLAQALPPALEGQDLQLTGVVASLPRQGLNGTRFEFDVESAHWQGQPVELPQRLSLGWYRGFDDGAMLSAPAAALRGGQRWQFTVRLRQPHGLMNPHGFDLELWLFERGLRASGTVRAPLNAPAHLAPQLLGTAPAYPLLRWRQHLRDDIFAAVPEAGTAGVLAALVIGDQAAIAREDWDLYRRTGVAHLMSISGLHVTMFAWLAAAVVRALWRRQPRLVLACPTPAAARWGGLALALAYALLAGWGVPAQRTVGMIALVAVVHSAGLRWPLHLVLLAVAVAISLADPWALLQPGFWLSFVAVALLVASEPVVWATPPAARAAATWRRAWAGLLQAVRGGLRTQAVATAGLAPLTLVFFQQLSLIGFAANLVAIPVVTLGVVPLALLGALPSPLSPPLWSLAALAVQGLDAWLQWLSAWPGAVWVAAVAPPWAMASGLLGGVLAVLPVPWRLRLLAVPLLLPLLAPPVPRPPPGQFEVLAADVGQGTAVLVRTHTRLLVYDTGPPFSPEADAGERVLLPLLQARGERRVDLLVLSHGDADHIGGAGSLMRGLPVAAVSSSLPGDHALLAGTTPHTRCQAGQRWHWDGVLFEVLHPLAQDHAGARKTNALSCVLRVQAAPEAGGQPGRSLLLTGDIEAAQEAALVQRLGAGLRSTALLVPHHGSRTSSTPALLIAVQPEVAVVQAAYRSRFGHPATEVLARYARYGVRLYRSDHCGAWAWPAGGPPVCQRQRARRYWHHQPQPSAPLPP